MGTRAPPLTCIYCRKLSLSGWAVLATGALVASLLAVGASPVGAQSNRVADEAEFTTALSACVGDALGDQMYGDVSDGHAFVNAINCIGYYGITNGTGDGSTFSPNDDVSRAEMALFIARAAGAAGVDLGDAMGDEFNDLGDTWQEARDAINQLASKGLIASGGDFRPGDAITRAEMASFLIGLLNKAASNVTIDSNGAIQLGPSGSTMVADDWFQDARSSVPAGNDAEISALYELGVTKGASAAAVQDKSARPLDYNYEPFGTVNRGEMAEFITRALAHTSVRPAGISAQIDGTDVVISARDDDFQTRSNVVVDIFRVDTNSVDDAFRGNGSCTDIVAEIGGTYVCEIDGADPITGGDGDTREPLGDVDKGGTTVWAWEGELEDTVDADTERYTLDVAEDAAPNPAAQVRITTEHPDGKKAHQGSSVIYTVQLEDENGNPTTIGTDPKRPGPARFYVTHSTTAFARIPDAADTDPSDGVDRILAISPQGEAVRTTLPLTTDSDGKATFSVTSLPDQDPGDNRDEYGVQIWIQPQPNGNAPAAVTATGTSTGDYYVGATSSTAATTSQSGIVTVRADDSATTVTRGAATVTTPGVFEGLIFSTEDSIRNVEQSTTANVVTYGATVSVDPAAKFVAASARGASTRATVTVTDQYGDPIVGARVELATALDSGVVADDAPTLTGGNIAGGRALAVGRDGSYTFGYEWVGDDTSATETLTASWDHDGDGCATATAADTPANPANTTATCADLDGDGTADDPGTAPFTGDAMVHWAVAADDAQGTPGLQIFEFDKDTNTIFVATDSDNTAGTAVTVNTAIVVYYDSNDRFDLDAGSDDATTADVDITYARFEKMLSTDDGYSLEWEAIKSGSRSINTFTLNTPAS